MKSWYSAKLVFESTINGVKEPNFLCEESIRVLLADSEEDARTRAEQIGRAAEHDYMNEAGESVRWQFVSVLEVQDLSETDLQDGTEVFSKLFRQDDSDP